MNREEDILRLKDKLTEMKQQLLSEAESARNSFPEENKLADMGDQATLETDRDFMLRLRSREQKLLTKIDSSMDKFTAGTYGICETCGEEIGIKRLDARPVAAMCIDCKTTQEEEEKLKKKKKN